MDTKLTDDSFKREINKSTIYFFAGEIFLKKKEYCQLRLSTDFVVNSKLTNYFVTFDIETIKLNNKLIPYSISLYDGFKPISVFIEGMNINKLFNDFILNLLPQRRVAYIKYQ